MFGHALVHVARARTRWRLSMLCFSAKYGQLKQGNIRSDLTLSMRLLALVSFLGQ